MTKLKLQLTLKLQDGKDDFQVISAVAIQNLTKHRILNNTTKWLLSGFAIIPNTIFKILKNIKILT